MRERGFALLIVLWSLVLLALILTQLLSAGRSALQLAANLGETAVAEAVADGAVMEALFHLTAAGGQSWAPRGTHVLRIGRGTAELAIEDLSGKVNPNTAGLQLLRALIGLCGTAPAQATQLARAIMAWRGAPQDDDPDPIAAYRAAGLPYAPPDMPFQSAEELALVAGMDPALLACLSPHLSLLQDGDPGLRSDDRMVARAVALAAQAGDPASDAQAPTDAVEIVAVARVRGGRFVRRVTARLDAAEDGRPFRILTWERN